MDGQQGDIVARDGQVVSNGHIPAPEVAELLKTPGRKPKELTVLRDSLIARKYRTPLIVKGIDDVERMNGARLAWSRLIQILRTSTDEAVVVAAANRVLEFSLGKPRPQGEESGDKTFIINIK